MILNSLFANCQHEVQGCDAKYADGAKDGSSAWAQDDDNDWRSEMQSRDQKVKDRAIRLWSRAFWDVHHVDGHFLVMWSAFRESGDWSNEFDEAAANGNFEGQDDY